MFEDLNDALLVIKKYNEMPLEEFVAAIEKESGNKIDPTTVQDWKYTGLTNIHFFEHVSEYYTKVIL